MAQPNPQRWLGVAASLLPFVFAITAPLLPLIIVFANTVPVGAPEVSKPLALSIALLFVALDLVALGALAAQRFPNFPAPVLAPFLTFAVIEAVAATLGSQPWSGLFSIAAQFLGVIIVAAMVATLTDVNVRRSFLACYLISATVAVIFAIVLSAMRQPPAMFSYEHGRASGTFLQPNEFAGYLLFVVPIGLAQIAAPRWLQWIGVTSAIVGAAGLVFSVSRAALIALAIGLSFFVARFGRKWLLLYATVVFVVFVVSALTVGNVAHDPSENTARLVVWSGAARLAERFSITGIGPLAFHAVYPLLRQPEATVNEVHAHSLPLQMFIEEGIFGFAALVWLAITGVRLALRAKSAIPSSDKESQLLFAALTAAFAGSLLQNLIDVVTTFLLILCLPMFGLMLALGVKPKADVAKTS